MVAGVADPQWGDGDVEFTVLLSASPSEDTRFALVGALVHGINLDAAFPVFELADPTVVPLKVRA